MEDEDVMKTPSAQVKSLPRRLWIVNEALRNGRLREGLEALTRVYEERNSLDRVLMADLLLNTKGPGQAERVLNRVVNETALPPDLRAMAHRSLGTALIYRNRFGEAVGSFERAVHFARKANDSREICEAQLGLLAAKVDCFGPTAVGTLMTEAFRSVQAAGDPHLLALLHFRVAVLEGRRGATDVARRHIELALSLLQKTANPWIESSVLITATAVSFVSADLVGALAHAERALALSRSCGAFFNELASLCNASQICVVLGRFDEASRYLEAAEPSAGDIPFLRFCLYDTKAQLQLATGDLVGCKDTLDVLTSRNAQDAESDRSFPQLESIATRIRLLQRQGHLDDAQKMAEDTAAAAQGRGERGLATTFQILRADILVGLGRIDEAAAITKHEAVAANRTGVDSLSVRAELEHVRGKILHKSGASQEAMRVLERSVRIHASIGHLLARDAAIATMDQVMAQTEAAQAGDKDQPVLPTPELPNAGLIESLACLSAFAGQPDLMATEAYAVVLASTAAKRLALLVKKSTGQTILREHNWPDAADSHDADGVMTFSLGTTKGCEFVLLVEPMADLLAYSCLAGLDALIHAAVVREEYQRERLHQGSVWPVEIYSERPGPLFNGQRMSEVCAQAMKVAKSPLTILLTGETGVGKEVLAKEIHRLSFRAEQEFQPIVCAAMAGGLLESQLFGHKKGSFTGATEDFPGVIRGAQGGTLFLDEIGELTTDLQIKLLRFLESKEIHPLGELRPLKVDVRIIAATNANLQQMVHDGKFREDLFYRLNVATFYIPPLRERREEIPSLVQHFLAQYSQQNHKPMPRVSNESLEYLLLYHWPGNVRELRNEMERLAGMVDAAGTIVPNDLKPQILAARKTSPAVPSMHALTVGTNQTLTEAVEQLEKEMISRVLNGYKGNLADAARALGITRKGLYHKRQRFGML
jgi:DNA-binding NtrC family response regulator/tetratricopeptide (TPR) repeat protein